MKKITKRIIATLMCAVLSMGMTVTAFAADTDTPVYEDPAEPQSIGSLLTSCGGSFSGGYGEFECNLPSTNYWTDIIASVSTGNHSGVVYCYVYDPN